MSEPAKTFRPTAPYDPDGDCIEFVAKPDPFRAERVNEHITVYYSQIDGALIGCLLKGVTRFFKQHGGPHHAQQTYSDEEIRQLWEASAPSWMIPGLGSVVADEPVIVPTQGGEGECK